VASSRLSLRRRHGRMQGTAGATPLTNLERDSAAWSRMSGTDKATALIKRRSDVAGRRPAICAGRGASTEIRAARLACRQAQAFMNATINHRISATIHRGSTNPGRANSMTTTHESGHDSTECTDRIQHRNPHQNPHPAWNPDCGGPIRVRATVVAIALWHRGQAAQSRLRAAQAGPSLRPKARRQRRQAPQ
jgi:hypothetical protein